MAYRHGDRMEYVEEPPYHERPPNYLYDARPPHGYEDMRFREVMPMDMGRLDDRRYSFRDPGPRHEDEGGLPPSRHLWVGNLTAEISQEMVAHEFGKFGETENVTIYSERNYAFVNFKWQQEAEAAKRLLQGTKLGGMGAPLRIEFAKGRGKPVRSIWVGGISKTTSKHQLQSEFARYGRIESFSLVRDRNVAFVDFANVEDAVAAVEHLNGKRLGEDKLRVDFARAATVTKPKDDDDDETDKALDGRRREGGAGTEAQKRGPDSRSGKASDEGEPSEILWVGFPLWVEVSEDILRREFSPYGEVSRVKTFGGRTYAFVEMTRLADARRAKEGLEGKLFNEPRVHIKFSKSMPNFAPDPREPPHPNGVLPSPPRRSGAVDRPRAPYPDDSLRLPRVDGERGRRRASGFHTPGPEGRSIKDSDFYRGMPPPLAPGRPMYEDWEEGRDREGLPPKRQRYEDPPPPTYAHLPPPGSRPTQDVGYRGPPPPPYLHAMEPPAPAGPWVGALAKGGALICGARAHPIGGAIDSPLPEMIDCTARTDLDTLAKHLGTAPAFGVLAIVPAENSDIPAYEEFVQYLGEKKRAGVAKMADGSTLFLVPPSDFSQIVLKIPRKDSLFGVAVNSRQGSAAQVLPPPPVAHYPPPQEQNPPSSHYFAHPPPQQQPAPQPPQSLPQGLSPEVLASLKALLPQNNPPPNHFGKQSNGQAAPQYSTQPPYVAPPQYRMPAPHDAVMQARPAPPAHQPYAPQYSLQYAAPEAQLQGVPGGMPQLPPDQLSQLAAILGQQQQQQPLPEPQAPAPVHQSRPVQMYNQQQTSVMHYEQASLAPPVGQLQLSPHDDEQEKRFQATLRLAAALLKEIGQSEQLPSQP